MMLYDMLLSSNRLTPEESVMLTPFLHQPSKVSSSRVEQPIKFLKEIGEEFSADIIEISKFRISKRTAISYGLQSAVSLRSG